MLHEIARVEPDRNIVTLHGAGDRQWIDGRLVVHEAIEDTGNSRRNPRAHQDVIHARQHRAVDLGQVGNLDLLQIVDAYGMLMSLMGQEDLHKVGNDAQLFELAVIVLPVLRQLAVGLCLTLPAGNEISVPDALRHRPKRKMIQRAPNVPATIAILQSPRENLIQRRPGNHSQLAQAGYSPCQPPAGDTYPHTTLNDRRTAHFLSVTWQPFNDHY